MIKLPSFGKKWATFIILAMISLRVFAPPPPPPSGHGTGGDQPAGGGAPIGEGIGLLIGLSGAFALRKSLRINQNRLLLPNKKEKN